MYHLHKNINHNLGPEACPEVNKGQILDGCGTGNGKLSHVEHFSQIFGLGKSNLSQ